MEAVRFKVEEVGAATAEFEAPLGLKSRIEIRRIGRNESGARRCGRIRRMEARMRFRVVSKRVRKQKPMTPCCKRKRGHAS